MKNDAKTPLFSGFQLSKLEANLMLLELKASNGLSDKGFNDLLSICTSEIFNFHEFLIFITVSK